MSKGLNTGPLTFEEATAHLAKALENVLRPILNGHPAGDDAVRNARRVLATVHGEGLIPEPNLRCNCTPCAVRRRRQRRELRP